MGVRTNNIMDRVKSSYTKLSDFREKRKTLLSEYIGNSPVNQRVPINLIETAVNIYVQRLVSTNPQVMITPKILDPDIRLAASKLQRAVNAYLPEIKFAEQFELAVKDAMFGIGIMKIGSDSGGVYAEHVSLDDFVFDMSVKSWNKVEFLGNRYEMNVDSVINYYELHGDKASAVKAAAGMESGPDGADFYRDVSEPTNRVRLWDIYIPENNEVIVLCSSDSNEAGGIEIDRYKWEGTPTGPFFTLSYNVVPDNTMPLPPVSMWLDIHELVNTLVHKLRHQSERQKTVTGFRVGSEEDARRVRDAQDGEMIPMSDPSSVAEFSFGGIDQQNLGFALAMKDLYSWAAGNLDSLGGLSPQAKTLGQDELLSATASQRIKSMQNKVIRFASEVTGAIVDNVYADTELTLDVAWKVDGFDDVVYYEKLTPQERCYDFRKFNVQINPSSLQGRSPEEKLAMVNQLLMQIVFPMMPALEAQGATINFESLFNMVADYSNIPEFKHVVEFSQSREPGQGIMTGSKMKSSPVSHRTYERVNKPAVNQNQREQQHINLAFGQRSQPAEKQTLVRQ
jgi:hypothetical protein